MPSNDVETLTLFAEAVSTGQARTANKIGLEMVITMHRVGTQVGTRNNPFADVHIAKKWGRWQPQRIRARIENPAAKPRWINGTVYLAGFTEVGLELRFEPDQPDRSRRAVRGR
jgi:hypothetical protein